MLTNFIKWANIVGPFLIIGFEMLGAKLGDVAMDSSQKKQHYRPLFTLLRVGSKEYAVLDKALANERAAIYLSRALYLIDSNDPARYNNTINYELLIACDLGSADAAFLLACRSLDPIIQVPFPIEDAVLFLKLAADRGHAEAAYQLASCYASMGQHKNTEQTCAHYFHHVDPAERARLAQHYFEIAAAAGHREAIEELVIAYAYGRGYINKDAQRFVDLCEKLITEGDQSVALGYGAWLTGMTVDGDDPLPEAIYLPKDGAHGLTCLIKASNGADIYLAQHALHLFSLAFYAGTWNSFPTHYVSKQLHAAVEAGSQLLALYFAWYAIPMHRRCSMPSFLDRQQLTLLASFVEQDEAKAMAYLDKALIGPNIQLSSIAKDLLLQVFSYSSTEVEGQFAN
ncbi:MAG: hypothetical protein K2Q14_04980 [Gammaproteobacteria bacterium]|nr:hypothetical protein [Gammaproteobacteria bacterium]